METKCIAVKVGKPLWKAITIAAMEGDSTIQDLVVPVLEKEFGGLVQKPSPVKREVVKEESQVVGGGLVSPVATKPVPVAAVVQAKSVSEFLCKACGKPTKGEFLCPTCKK